MAHGDPEDGPTIDLALGTAVYGTKNIEVGVDETDRGYLEVETLRGISHKFSVDKGEIEDFTESLAAESEAGPTLQAPEDMPEDIDSPEGWTAAVEHTGGGIWLIIFRKCFNNGRRIEVTADVNDPQGVSIGGYRDGYWLGEIAQVELYNPSSCAAIDAAREMIEALEDGWYVEECREVFS